MDFKPYRLLCLWDFWVKNTGVGWHFLPQGIFPTQGLNLFLLLGRQILFHWATSVGGDRSLKKKIFLANTERIVFEENNFSFPYQCVLVQWQLPESIIMNTYKANPSSIDQELVNFLWECPDDRYFHLCRLHILCCKY